MDSKLQELRYFLLELQSLHEAEVSLLKRKLEIDKINHEKQKENETKDLENLRNEILL